MMERFTYLVVIRSDDKSLRNKMMISLRKESYNTPLRFNENTLLITTQKLGFELNEYIRSLIPKKDKSTEYVYFDVTCSAMGSLTDKKTKEWLDEYTGIEYEDPYRY